MHTFNLSGLRIKVLPLAAALFLLAGSSVQAQNTEQIQNDLRNIDILLGQVKPRQNTLVMDDMIFDVKLLKNYRDTLTAKSKGGLQPRFAQSNTANKWPRGIVYYEYSLGVWPEYQLAFEQACRVWEGIAKVRFVPATTGNRIFVINSGVNSSHVGMMGDTYDTPGGRQQLNIKDWGWVNIICHELAHTLGIIHEHNRSDRDSYVTINWQNIRPGYEHNFYIVPGSLNPVEYDFLSIMHYSPNAFAITNSSGVTFPSITAHEQYQAIASRMGQRYDMTDLDKAGMRALYGPPTPWEPLAVTATTKSDSSIEVKWQKNAGNTTNFKVLRSTNGATFTPIAEMNAETLTYLDTGLNPGATYYYQVIATNAEGPSDPSNTASARTYEQGLTFGVAVTHPADGSGVR